jgi:hypothetical protein
LGTTLAQPQNGMMENAQTVMFNMNHMAFMDLDTTMLAQVVAMRFLDMEESDYD